MDSFFNKKHENCKESSFSGTLGNNDGDRGLNSIPWGIGGEKRPGNSGNGFLGFHLASLVSILFNLVKNDCPNPGVHCSLFTETERTQAPNFNFLEFY